MALTAEEIAANRAKLAAKMKNSGQKVGSSRRKNNRTNKSGKANQAHFNATLRLVDAIHKLNTKQVQGIEEINMFTDDGNVIHFKKPTVENNKTTNVYIIDGPNETKKFSEIFKKQPGILKQLGMDGFKALPESEKKSSIVWAKAVNTAQEAKNGKN